MDAKALYRLSYGLFILSVNCWKRDNACIINTAVQVASSPDRLSISVSKSDHTCDMLAYTDEFTLSVLSEEADFGLIRRFGFQSGRDVEKFDGFDDAYRAPNGAFIVTRGTNAWLSAHIEQRVDLGSHMLFIARITDGEVLSSVPSATYAYYQSVIKPRSAPSASPKWRCRVCGYEYDGEELPADFICPTCKHGASDFERV